MREFVECHFGVENLDDFYNRFGNPIFRPESSLYLDGLKNLALKMFTSDRI